jgi:hypothetical protein
MRRRAVALQQRIGSRVLPGLVPALAVAAAVCLSGCVTSMSEMSQKMAEGASQLPHVGLSPNAPARPTAQMAYPAVHDVPPPRTAAVLTNVEQHKLETDLVAARDQQQTAAGVPVASRKKKEAAKAEASKPEKPKTEATKPAPIPAASSRTIY